MKLLLFYAHRWWYRTASKSLVEVADISREESMANAVVVFFHAEKEDEARGKGVIEKFVKNVKWLAGKFSTKSVVLHSFNHLSASKSSPEYAGEVLAEVATRLRNAGYDVMCTPFGYFNEFSVHVGGESLAKVFKEI